MSARRLRISRWSLLFALVLAIALAPSHPAVSPVALAQASISSVRSCRASTEPAMAALIRFFLSTLLSRNGIASSSLRLGQVSRPPTSKPTPIAQGLARKTLMAMVFLI